MLPAGSGEKAPAGKLRNPACEDCPTVRTNGSRQLKSTTPLAAALEAEALGEGPARVTAAVAAGDGDSDAGGAAWFNVADGCPHPVRRQTPSATTAGTDRLAIDQGLDH